MRRRIYIDPEGDLQDITDEPYRWDSSQEPFTRAGWCRQGVLRDEALWSQYQAAVAELNRLWSLVRDALKYEPLDAVEIDLHTRAIQDVNHDAMEVIAAEALTHASRWCCISCERADLGDRFWLERRFPMCVECGNKRCPRATFHDNRCTASNESGQPGSEYR